MNKQPMIYLAGPYTKPDPVINTRNAILTGQRLRDELDAVIQVPHVTHFEHMLAPKPYDYWLRIDIEILRHCQALFRMPGESSGADLEVKEAERLHIPVFYSEESLRAWRHNHKLFNFEAPYKVKQ